MYAADALYNLVSTNSIVNLTSDDPFGTPNNVTALSQPLAAGSTVFTATLLSAQDASAVAITASSCSVQSIF